MSWAWVPEAATIPSSRSTTRSANTIVDSRWAIRIVVRADSAVLDSAVVDGFLDVYVDRAGGVVEDQHAGATRRVRAMAIRWRWPPESV